MKTLYIYGPPASGKSTLARKLSAFYGRESIDLDKAICEREGCSIPEIFEKYGEAGFRKIESEVLREIKAPIVALGGGTLLNEDNRHFAEENGFVIVLNIDEETIARRIERAKGTRPLGNKLAERRAHYASFAHQVDGETRIILPRPLRGKIVPPVSKSHFHRLLIAEFLAHGDINRFQTGEEECADIAATRRCIAALAQSQARGDDSVTLDCGESGSTLRFFAPIAAALGFKAEFIRCGRLAERPMMTYDKLESGVHELRGDISSQFVTGLLFALPLLKGDSEIRFTTPLQSRGYVDMTLDVLKRYEIRIEETAAGFVVPGFQKYVSSGDAMPERDWSGAAFWFAANALGSAITVAGMNANSCQPDRVVCEFIEKIKAANNGTSVEAIDVSGCPDNYPALAAVNHYLGGKAEFIGTERLRIKESDRIASMEEVFASPNDVDPHNDHRIAMAAAVLATCSDSPTIIHNAKCVNKSYPGFFEEFKLDLYMVTGWPLLKTRSPEIHNEAHRISGTKAEMISYPAPTIEKALEFARLCDVKAMAVTIPHKQSVMQYLNWIDKDAEAIGAVNTVVFRNGKRYGYNTDVYGITEALTNFTGRKRFDGMKTVLLGAGGAACAVACALKSLGADNYILNRTFDKAEKLAGQYGFKAIKEMIDCELVVNATNTDPIADWRFKGTEYVYDLVYVPEVTKLNAHALECGCKTENGFSMLKAQARRQLEIFLCSK